MTVKLLLIVVLFFRWIIIIVFEKRGIFTAYKPSFIWKTYKCRCTQRIAENLSSVKSISTNLHAGRQYLLICPLFNYL